MRSVLIHKNRERFIRRRDGAITSTPSNITAIWYDIDNSNTGEHLTTVIVFRSYWSTIAIYDVKTGFVFENVAHYSASTARHYTTWYNYFKNINGSMLHGFMVTPNDSYSYYCNNRLDEVLDVIKRAYQEEERVEVKHAIYTYIAENKNNIRYMNAKEVIRYE